jgi:hypothetical protein
LFNNNNYNESANAGGGILWRYSATLSVSLAAWLVYLILPKGFKKAYCRAGRRRYLTTTTSPAVTTNSSSTKAAATTVSSYREASASAAGRVGSAPHHTNLSRSKTVGRNHQQQQQQQQQQRGNHRGLTVNTTHTNTASTDPYASFFQGRDLTPDSVASSNSGSTQQLAPSPEHPALTRIPDQRILQGTMDRLLGAGIRLMAHGVQCDPKRVWIRLHMPTDSDNGKDHEQQEHSLSWQTEFPRQITDNSGRTSIVLFRGATHKIDLGTVLYVDVGKKTSALMKTDTPNAGTGNGTTSTVPATACFSLLTANGSLDLQTNSRLERDALVACLSMVLDQVHQTHEWRRLYEESTIVTMASQYQPSQFNLSNIGTDLFPTSHNKNNGKNNKNSF